VNTLRGDATGKEPLWSKILSGGLSGGIGSAISNPFDLLKVGASHTLCFGLFMVPEPSRRPSLSSLISDPFDLLKARMQANAGKAPPGMVATAAEIVREGGILGLWKGTSTTVRHSHTHTHAQAPTPCVICVDSLVSLV